LATRTPVAAPLAATPPAVSPLAARPAASRRERAPRRNTPAASPLAARTPVAAPPAASPLPERLRRCRREPAGCVHAGDRAPRPPLMPSVADALATDEAIDFSVIKSKLEALIACVALGSPSLLRSLT